MTIIKCNAPCEFMKDDICQKDEIEIHGYISISEGCRWDDYDWMFDCQNVEFNKDLEELYGE